MLLFIFFFLLFFLFTLDNWWWLCGLHVIEHATTPLQLVIIPHHHRSFNSKNNLIILWIRFLPRCGPLQIPSSSSLITCTSVFPHLSPYNVSWPNQLLSLVFRLSESFLIIPGFQISPCFFPTPSICLNALLIVLRTSSSLRSRHGSSALIDGMHLSIWFLSHCEPPAILPLYPLCFALLCSSGCSSPHSPFFRTIERCHIAIPPLSLSSFPIVPCQMSI